MIYISGMEDGSGDGSAASSKAGWLPRQRSAMRVAQAVLPALPALLRAAMTPPPPPDDGPARQSPPRPTLGPDGRPLPPDGSAPPLRPQTGPIPATTATPAADASTNPVSAAGPGSNTNRVPVAGGRPMPPAGAAPNRPRRAAASQQRHPVAATHPSGPAASTDPQNRSGVNDPTGPYGLSGPTTPRAPGTPLPPGGAPTAPAGHRYTVRPVAAPAGEFLFEVRCSCGGSRSAAVTLAALKHAAARGLPASEAIAIATQDALDALHQ